MCLCAFHSAYNSKSSFAYANTCTHSLAHPHTHSSLTHALTPHSPHTHSLPHSPTHSLPHLSTLSFPHSLTHTHTHTNQSEYLLLPQVLFHLPPQQQPTHNLEQQQGPPPRLDLHKMAAQISHLGFSLHQLGFHLVFQKGE